jgi:ribonuclease P protein component
MAALLLKEDAPGAGRDWPLPSLPSNSFLLLQFFPKSERLLKRREFLQLSSSRRKIHTKHFIIIRGDVGTMLTRIGITVSRKTGNAVARNHCKRLVREFYRRNKGLFITSDYNVIAKPGAAQLEFLDLVQELADALKRLG